MTGTTRSIRRALVGLALAVILGAPPITAATGAGGDSPQEVFEEALAANRRSDMATLLSLVAPAERGRVLLDLFDMAASACTQSPEQVAPLCALLEESGLAERIPAALEGVEAEAELRFEPRMAHQRERASAIFAGVDVPAFGQRLKEVLRSSARPMATSSRGSASTPSRSTEIARWRVRRGARTSSDSWRWTGGGT
jgi:hypothetical protein